MFQEIHSKESKWLYDELQKEEVVGEGAQWRESDLDLPARRRKEKKAAAAYRDRCDKAAQQQYNAKRVNNRFDSVREQPPKSGKDKGKQSL